jgi:hypothetical protein
MPGVFDLQLANRQLQALQKELGRAERQTKRAAAIALNNTAFKAKAEIEKNMLTVFDRPTRYTMRATFVERASASGSTQGYATGELRAAVKFKDAELSNRAVPPVNYLIHQVEGGTRQQKRFEVALQRIGILPQGWRAVPGEGAEIDQNGNMKPSQIIQILSYFQAFGETGYRANSTAKTRARLRKGGKRRYGRAYFAAIPGRQRTLHLQPGIYLRQYGGLGVSLRPVLIFVRAVRYAPRLDFYGIARRTFDKHIANELDRAVEFINKPRTR